MIEVNDLHKSFGKVKVLNGIHLERSEEHTSELQSR